MNAHVLREKFLAFFKEKGHAIIPSSSLIPEHDPTVLFTTAGMHPLVPYLLGEPHPAGKRLANSQKCLRTDDISEVGDATHLTFFEMLGNWSLGDYWKSDAIRWSFEFLTGKKWLGLDPSRIFTTVFKGDDDAPFDEESAEIWQTVFREKGIDAKLGERIFTYGKDKNWWGPAGATGPCGPDTEMFYDTGRSHEQAHGSACHPNCPCGKYVEIWNDVFMQYNKQPTGYLPLAQRNVDTGLGLERMAAIVSDTDDIYRAEPLASVMRAVETVVGAADEVKARIITDHLRAATFVLGDSWGVSPSNKDQGYVVRRLIRRAVVQAWLLDRFENFAETIARSVIAAYGEAYPELRAHEKKILAELDAEESKFRETLSHGIKMIGAIVERGERQISGETAFVLYATYGFPIELTKEIFSAKTAGAGIVDEPDFKRRFEEHQHISRAGSAQKFAGGLADHSAEVVKGHTATHLLHKALLTVLGPGATQRGSNITKERLRFDFSWPTKLTPEQISSVEQLVNEQIERDLPVRFEIVDVAEAKRIGAIGLFDDTYAALGNKIKVYFIGNDAVGYFSKEVCGGPHVEHTGALGGFTIIKEEAVSAGVRRIKAVVRARARRSI